MAYMEWMVSIASQTSGVRAWELARDAQHYDIMHPLLDQDILCLSIRQPQQSSQHRQPQ